VWLTRYIADGNERIRQVSLIIVIAQQYGDGNRMTEWRTRRRLRRCEWPHRNGCCGSNAIIVEVVQQVCDCFLRWGICSQRSGKVGMHMIGPRAAHAAARSGTQLGARGPGPCGVIKRG